MPNLLAFPIKEVAVKNIFAVCWSWIYAFLALTTFDHSAIAGNCFGCCAVVANGALTLTTPLNIKNTSDKVVRIAAGRYETELKFTDNNQVIAIQILRAAGKNQVFEMRLPEGVIASGEFVMTAQQIGQEFDVIGQVTQNTVRTPTRIRMDSCSWTETYWGVRRPVQVVRFGTQRVVYHTIDTTHNNRLQFLINSISVGSLEANRHTSYQVVEDMGPCI